VDAALAHTRPVADDLTIVRRRCDRDQVDALRAPETARFEVRPRCYDLADRPAA
jgi:hypothetical protein